MLNDRINNRYLKEINKIESICKTAEVTLSNMLYDMVDKNKD